MSGAGACAARARSLPCRGAAILNRAQIGRKKGAAGRRAGAGRRSAHRAHAGIVGAGARRDHFQLARFEHLLVLAMVVEPAAQHVVVVAQAGEARGGLNHQHAAMPADRPHRIARLCPFAFHVGLHRVLMVMIRSPGGAVRRARGGAAGQAQVGAVACSSVASHNMACSRVVPHISADGCRPAQTAGRSGRPKIRQPLSSLNWMQRMPAGLPVGVCGT